MLDLLCGEGIAWMDAEALHPGVCCAIKEDDEGLYKLAAWISGGGGTVPGPTQLGKGPEESGEREETIAPEYRTLCRNY